MEKTIEERVSEISENLNKISLSLARLWEVNSSGIPPHKTTARMMSVAIFLSALCLLIVGFVAFEAYFLLEKVNAIYSLML